ncbi:MAG: MFS transporter [Verrucomicrobiaceae bacterium]|nr:MFS transporter [Verrucomicrobiaceae bacterium]
MRDLPQNARLFCLFRVFFNCRFYYPVYMVMFGDFGLSIAQFATLNLVWAITIVLLEVPSGALADHLGRRKLVVASAILMIAEILVLILTPAGSSFVFGMFVINRVLSGAAEAAASGADEAMAYESIPEKNRQRLWGRTMKLTMIGMSIGFVITSIAGALVYSPHFMNSLLSSIGFDADMTKTQTLKFPLYLNLSTALAVLLIATRFEEPATVQDSDRPRLNAIRESFSGTIRAGQWILKSPAATTLMLTGLFYDSIIRVFYTVSSNVYKLIKLPEWTWGFVGASASIIGIGVALLCERMARGCSPSVNFMLVTILTFAGCMALANPVPLWGVVLLLPMLTSMRFLQYFLSYYLNQVTPSEQRATVLSFKGASMNLSFGILTQIFGVVTAQFLWSGQFSGSPDPELAAFAHTLTWWPAYLAIGVILLFTFTRWRYGKGITKLIEEGKTENAPGH